MRRAMSEAEVRAAEAESARGDASRPRLPDIALTWPSQERADPPPSGPAPRGTEARRPAGPLYAHLVEGEDDVIGLVAYALYKRDKREFLANLQKQRGNPPTPDQLDAFTASVLTAGQRDRYRASARQVLDAYAGVAVEAERPTIVETAVSGRVERAARRIEATGRWWRLVLAAFAGAALFAAAVVGTYYGLGRAGIDLFSLLPKPLGSADVTP